MGHGGEFQAAVAACSEALPFVLEDVVAHPAFFVGVGGSIPGVGSGFCFTWIGLLNRNANDLTFALIIEVDGPVVNPIRPVFGEYLSLSFAAIVLA